MSNKKIQIDALPCSNGSFNCWYWGMITWWVIETIFIRFDIFVSFFAYIPNIPALIFLYIFAKGLKSISNSLYSVVLAILGLRVASSFFIDALIKIDPSSFVGVCVIVAIELILGIYFMVYIFRNYSGLLGNLGKGLLQWCLIILFIVSLAVLSSVFNIDSHIAVIVILVLSFLFMLFCTYKNILSPMYDLLYSGYMDNLTEDEMQAYLKSEGISGSSGIHEKVSDKPQETPVETSTASVVPSTIQSNDSITSKKGKVNYKMWLFIALGVIAVLLIVGGILLFGGSKDKSARYVDEDEYDEYVLDDSDDEIDSGNTIVNSISKSDGHSSSDIGGTVHYYKGYFETDNDSFPIEVVFVLNDRDKLVSASYRNLTYGTKLKMDIEMDDDEIELSGYDGSKTLTITLNSVSGETLRGKAKYGNLNTGVTLRPSDSPNNYSSDN